MADRASIVALAKRRLAALDEAEARVNDPKHPAYLDEHKRLRHRHLIGAERDMIERGLTVQRMLADG